MNICNWVSAFHCLFSWATVPVLEPHSCYHFGIDPGLADDTAIDGEHWEEGEEEATMEEDEIINPEAR